ncbi:MAG: DUF1178 family protein [Sphingobium sp.]|nr:DUF1178 family protein [Sphingobium sp.]MCP5398895.1 DUF1178 family protein [Sphingomonas sp.]
MIIFDLKCAHAGHVFEGWFASSDDYAQQKERGLLSCPMCGDTDIEKAVMAPAVPAKGNQRTEQPIATIAQGSGADTVPMTTGMDSQKAAEMMNMLAKAQAEALSSSEWVGRKFADKARAMHYGEEDKKAIHGEVAPEEARNLIDEGVEVAPLLFPVVPPEAQN